MVAIATFCIPFIAVWISVLFTAFTINHTDVFSSTIFWGISLLYWILWVCTLGLILEEID